ncbi:hypothetical protein MA9V1_025 [Chryseobacterium phage MA9V-1]|nr:hypothetical protein MA9V1_025 [Chryseobacterium phage MA9V-1]
MTKLKLYLKMLFYSGLITLFMLMAVAIFLEVTMPGRYEFKHYAFNWLLFTICFSICAYSDELKELKQQK